MQEEKMSKNMIKEEKKIQERVYASSLIANMPRVLNQLDRNPTSATFGCFDREYWQYKTIDFPCARKQEGVLSLALLFMKKFHNNTYFGVPVVRSWCEAGIEFWAKTQNADGSCNEWYPEEHSFVATAFSTYAITEAILVLRIPCSSAVLEAVCKAGRFLQQHTEFRVQNQQTGAIIALYNCSLVTGKEEFSMCAAQRLGELAQYQTKEGWFDEYGGPDIGYLSVAIDYLGKYYKKTKDKRALSMMQKAMCFLKNFVHPDGSVGGVFTSRSTEYLIPSAFEHELGDDGVFLAYVCRKGVQSGRLPSCSTLDDRYLLYNGYTYVQAELHEQKLPKNIPECKTGSWYFSECGWFLRRTKNYFIVINTKKGGAFYFVSQDNKVHDAGVFVTGTPIFTSSFVNSSAEIELTPKTPKLCNKIVIRGILQPTPEEVLTPLKNMLLRSTQLTIGKNQTFRNAVKEVLRDRLIASQKNNTSLTQQMLKSMIGKSSKEDKGIIRFERSFFLSEDSVVVEDTIHNAPSGAVYIVGAKQAVQTVPSSRFFVPGDLESHIITSKTGVIHRRLL